MSILPRHHRNNNLGHVILRHVGAEEIGLGVTSVPTWFVGATVVRFTSQYIPHGLFHEGECSGSNPTHGWPASKKSCYAERIWRKGHSSRNLCWASIMVCRSTNTPEKPSGTRVLHSQSKESFGIRHRPNQPGCFSNVFTLIHAPATASQWAE